MPQRIRSLQELKEWNENPTEEIPILYEWFLVWFFDEVLMKNKKKLAMEAHEEHIKFGMICNKFTREQSIERVNSNLGYYAGYSAKWAEKLKKYFPHIKHSILNG